VTPPPFPTAAADALVRLALAEDLGDAGDVTSLATVPADRHGRATLVARSPGVVAGLPVIGCVLRALNASVPVTAWLADGTAIERGTRLATLDGPLRKILTAERTVLNFLQRLSGVATLTRRYADAVAGLPVALLDTRKTTPGWRLLEKYAVRLGGGTNHRVGLYDGVLIKDNHLAGFPDQHTAVRDAVAAARAHPAARGLPLEIEVDTPDQFREALAVRPDIILLDNMNNEQLREAVDSRNAIAPGVLLEASGGVNLGTVRAIAETGVDRISVGALTHSATALDIGLDYDA
jgi:nicotinate-nucleotide pyrophosphorylase (carboxylating)